MIQIPPVLIFLYQLNSSPFLRKKKKKKKKEQSRTFATLRFHPVSIYIQSTKNQETYFPLPSLDFLKLCSRPSLCDKTFARLSCPRLLITDTQRRGIVVLRETEAVQWIESLAAYNLFLFFLSSSSSSSPFPFCRNFVDARWFTKRVFSRGGNRISRARDHEPLDTGR